MPSLNLTLQSCRSTEPSSRLLTPSESSSSAVHAPSIYILARLTSTGTRPHKSAASSLLALLRLSGTGSFSGSPVPVRFLCFGSQQMYPLHKLLGLKTILPLCRLKSTAAFIRFPQTTIRSASATCARDRHTEQTQTPFSSKVSPLLGGPLTLPLGFIKLKIALAVTHTADFNKHTASSCPLPRTITGTPLRYTETSHPLHAPGSHTYFRRHSYTA